MAPLEWMFIQALLSGQEQASWFLGLLVVPLWILAPIGAWGFYRDRRKITRGEFTERSSPASADEPQ